MKKRIAFSLILVSIFITSCFLVDNQVAIASDEPDRCRFGINVAYGHGEMYDYEQIGANAYIDFGYNDSNIPPHDWMHLRILTTRDGGYQSTYDNLGTIISSHLGEHWVIGNEPDVAVWQDSITPQVYAERFFAYAKRIRQLDPTAIIGFGPISQASPLRIEYLQRVWTRLEQLVNADSSISSVSSLIDVWTVHAFILDESGNWGAGIPLGMSDYTGVILNYKDKEYVVKDIEKFKERVIATRAFMKEKGERNKPLWIKEFGVVFPPEDPLGVYVYTVSDEDTRDFMIKAFNYLLTAKDVNLGNPNDENRLVQRFFWYSLNDNRWNHGGQLYYRNTDRLTIIGEAYRAYNPPSEFVENISPDLQPLDISIYPYAKGTVEGTINYKVNIEVKNNQTSNFTMPLQIELYNGAIKIGTINSEVSRCGAARTFSINWVNVVPGQNYALKAVVIQEMDIVPTNNELLTDLYASNYYPAYLPVILK